MNIPPYPPHYPANWEPRWWTGGTGWECPKCGAVYAPTTPQCFHCGPKKTVTKDGTADEAKAKAGP